MSLFQALFGGVGQAIQPLVSANHGAGNDGRNRSFFRMGLLTVGVMGIAFCALGEFFPAALVAFFVRATPGLLSAAAFLAEVGQRSKTPSGVRGNSLSGQPRR